MLPIVFGFIAYRAAFRTVERTSRQASMSILDHTRLVVEGTLREVGSIVNRLSLDPKLRQFGYVNDPYGGARVYRIVEAVHDVQDLVPYDDLILDFFVIYPSNGVVVGRNTAYHLDEFYPQIFSYSGISAATWKTRYLSAPPTGRYYPAEESVFGSERRSIITYLQSFPYPGDDQPKAMVWISNKGLEALLRGIDISRGGWVGMLGRDDSILSSISSDRFSSISERAITAALAEGPITQVAGTRVSISIVTSETTGFRFVTILPLSVVGEDVRKVQTVTMLMALITMLSGLGVAGVLAYQNMKPVRLLVHDNEALRRAVRGHLPFLRSSFFERLFRGEFTRDPDVDESLARLDLGLEGAAYQVAVARIVPAGKTGSEAGYTEDGIDATRQRRLMVSRVVSDMATTSRIFLHDVEDDKLAVLFLFNDPEAVPAARSVEPFISNLKQVSEDDVHSRLIFGVGDVYTNRLQISRSYREAHLALEHQAATPDAPDIVWFPEIPRKPQRYSYPPDVENRLIGLVLSGNETETLELLESLYDEHVKDRHPESIVARLFSRDLACTAMRIADAPSVAVDFEDSTIEQTLSSVLEQDPFRAFETLKTLLRRMCRGAALNKKSHNVRLIDGITGYIGDNYMNPQIGLALVAEKFGISEVYLSQFFKEQTGTNFGAYLQDLRMKRARELLDDPAKPVKTVVSMCGYQTYATFARAFKRVYGISATDYRDAGIRNRSS